MWGGSALSVGGAGFWVDADDEQVFACVVDGDVLAGFEEPQFADPLSGNPRCCEVGYAAGLELDANVGDVDFGGQDGQANGADFADGGVGEGEHDIEVVDHEVEDHVDIE